MFIPLGWVLFAVLIMKFNIFCHISKGYSRKVYSFYLETFPAEKTTARVPATDVFDEVISDIDIDFI